MGSLYILTSRFLHILIYVLNSYMVEANKNDGQNLVTDYSLKLGMEFGSEQEAYKFYNEYGRNYGFSIRKD